MFRYLAERKNIFVETVVDFEEMRQLSREEGWDLEKLFVAMKENGASSVAVSEDTLASLESEGRITVLSSKEIRKLSIDEGLKQDLPEGVNTSAALWVHSEESELLDRIEQQLSWRIPAEKLIRIHRNFLLINKSAKGFKERVGLGFSRKYFDMAQKAGLGLVVRVFNYPGLTATGAAKIISSIPSPATTSALLFAEEEMLGNRGDLPGIIDLFKDRSYRIGWIEFNTQEGIDAYLRRLSGSRPFVRVHSISRKEIDQVYNRSRAVARWVRAVKDRSMKMLYIRCFFQDDSKYIADLVKFNLAYLKSIASSLNQAGFKIASNYEERISEPRHRVGVLSGAERVAMAIALLLGFPLLVKFSFVPELDEKWFFMVVPLTLIAYLMLNSNHFNAFAGLLGAISYSTVGVALAIGSLKDEKKSGVSGILKYLGLMVLPSVLGGILIAGLHSEIEYLLKFKQFRGIKFAFMIPVVWVFVWSLKEYGKGFFALLNKPVTPITALIGACLGFGLVVYLLRSGNLTIVKPSAIEDAFRTFLENTLIARPRNKEFLIGYPAAALFLFFLARKCYSILPIVAVFIQMGQVSVMNTFCHFHSSLSLSILRVFNGFWLGVLVAIPVTVIVALLWLLNLFGEEKGNKVLLAGYLGFGNYGDELLWQGFCERFLERHPEYEVCVLLKDEGNLPGNFKERVRPVGRQSYFTLLETLLSVKALIFPGGGVLQSSTSLLSLLYYTSLIFICKIAGARILLPAQGIGPWCGHDDKHKWFFKRLGKMLSSVDYISLRDYKSREFLQKIAKIDAIVSADYAFLAKDLVRQTPSPAKGSLTVAVVLRESVFESERIAKSLIELFREVENLSLLPVVFQQDDEKTWRNAGWDKEIYRADYNSARNFSDCDLVVSMRLHGCIVATAQAIPWIGIAYDPKVAGFAEACAWKYCYLPENVDKKLLEEKLNLLAVNKLQLAEKLSRKANELARRAEADFETVTKLL
ncbi:MAG: hypothetical protein Kow0029_31110 [Candidatus Rifleibacteriota bacterium]